MFSLKFNSTLFVLIACFLPTNSVSTAADSSAKDAEADEQVEQRLLESARYLASDELQGRGVGTKGLDRAASYIANQFQQAGLLTDLYEGKPFQVIKRSGTFQLGRANSAAFVGPKKAKVELKLGKDFTPLSLSGSGILNLPLVFAGYGITADDLNYDDYAGLDVTEKAVIVLRHEPQRGEAGSVFDGTKTTDHAYLYRKIANAVDHGAAAIIFCTGGYELKSNLQSTYGPWQRALNEMTSANVAFQKIENPSLDQLETHRKKVDELVAKIQKYGKQLGGQTDKLLDFRVKSSLRDRQIPVLHCQRSVVDQVLKIVSKTDLNQLEQAIDQDLKPRSQLLTGWKISGQVSVDWKGQELKNVLGLLRASGGNAEETVVVGAHYDHLGLGGWGSLDFSFRDQVHNGADDNASGTSVLMEVARQLTQRRGELKRNVLFIAFTAEEQGLIGSKAYVENALIPMDETVAMLNLDMVGRLRTGKLTVFGTGTAKEFDGAIDQIGKTHDFLITKRPGGFGPSDHASFYGKRVPVLHFFTGFHPQYHRPSDDFDKLNIQGMRRISAAVAELTIDLATQPKRPTFRETTNSPDTSSLLQLFAGSLQGTTATVGPQKNSAKGKPFVGVQYDASKNVSGYAISTVLKGGPGQRAGLRTGDVILQFGDNKLSKKEDLLDALKARKPGETVPVLVQRGKLLLEMEVTLGRKK